MRVRIFKPAKSAAQSGMAKAKLWVVEAEKATPRLPEPIMGWAGAQDTFSALKGRLHFLSAEDALAFVKRKGWEVTFSDAAEKHIHPHNYMDNFRIIRPQDEERAAR